MLIKLLKSIKNSGSIELNLANSKSVLHRKKVSMRMRMHTRFPAC